MTNEERLEKVMEFIMEKQSQGWVIETISTGTFTNDSGKPSFALELILEQQ